MKQVNVVMIWGHGRICIWNNCCSWNKQSHIFQCISVFLFLVAPCSPGAREVRGAEGMWNGWHEAPRKIQDTIYFTAFLSDRGLYTSGFSTKSLSVCNSLSIVILASFPVATILEWTVHQSMTSSYLWCPVMSRVGWEKGGYHWCPWFNRGIGGQAELWSSVHCTRARATCACTMQKWEK